MRDAESIAPVAAKPAATKSGAAVVEPSARWKISATRAAPELCPTKRAVASIPLAEPLREAGAEAIIIELLGDWKMPKPAPHKMRRRMMSVVDVLLSIKPNSTSPNAIILNPESPRIPA